MVYRYMTENIGFMGATWTGSGLGGEGFGGEIHGPEHHPRSVEVDTAGVHDAEDFRPVQGEVAPVHGHTKPRERGDPAGTGHVVEAGASVEVMAAAGASADGCSVTVAAVGKSVTADTDDQGTRMHRDLRGSKVQGKFTYGGLREGKRKATLRK